MVALGMNDLVNRYIKDGKDHSDFYRGFISALKQVMLMKDGLKNIDSLKATVKGGQ